MFRKLIANLSYSPSLIGALGIYASHLKHEERMRFMGLIFLMLAIIMQVIVTLSPPESANKASSHDLLYGGVTSKSDLLAKYDRNEQNLQDIYTTLGITRTDILATKSGMIDSNDFTYTAARTSLFSPKDGERAVTYKKAGGGSGTLYAAPSQLYTTGTLVTKHGTSYRALTGTSPSVGRFAILESSGNVVLSKLAHDSPDQPCPSDYSTHITSLSCQEPIAQSQTVFNNTQRIDARATVAAPSDRISYMTQFSNLSGRSISPQLSTSLGDILEYADVVDTEGGTFDANGKSITWPVTSLDPHSAVTRTFTVRIKTQLPVTAQGASNPTSFDCMLISPIEDPRTDLTQPVKVRCPAPKLVEAVSSQLPYVDPIYLLIGSGSILTLSMYLYGRARQQREELRLIRKDLNTGDTLI